MKRLNLQISGNYREVTLAGDGSRLIHFENRLPAGINSFTDAVSPAKWVEHFQPFGVVIVNHNSRRITLVRDHLGQAALFYWFEPGKRLVVGETLPEVLQHLSSHPPFSQSELTHLFATSKRYSDETLYQNIFRVEPGHFVHFDLEGTPRKEAFWQLRSEGKELTYKTDEQYLEHFSALMRESIRVATDGYHEIAAEFSAGLDSSSVYCVANDSKIPLKLFMHVTRPGSPSLANYNEGPEKRFIDHFQLTGIERICEEHFDSLSVFREYTKWFAGPPPYIFTLFASPLHRAVARGKHPILLSGFGGDQGVSGHVPVRFVLPMLISQGRHHEAWQLLPAKRLVHKYWQYLQHSHPTLYSLGFQLENARRPSIQRKLRKQPYYSHYFRSLREAEWSFLQGPFSHEVRMRIEDSAIIGRKLGFQYRYPLLYPKLLEFFLAVPATQKYRAGTTRFLLRRYLSQFVPENCFSDYRKEQGLGIVPSTFEHFKEHFEQGRFRDEFATLPFADLRRRAPAAMASRNSVKAFMIQTVLANRPR